MASRLVGISQPPHEHEPPLSPEEIVRRAQEGGPGPAAAKKPRARPLTEALLETELPAPGPVPASAAYDAWLWRARDADNIHLNDLYEEAAGPGPSATEQLLLHLLRIQRLWQTRAASLHAFIEQGFMRLNLAVLQHSFDTAQIERWARLYGFEERLTAARSNARALVEAFFGRPAAEVSRLHRLHPLLGVHAVFERGEDPVVMFDRHTCVCVLVSLLEADLEGLQAREAEIRLALGRLTDLIRATAAAACSDGPAAAAPPVDDAERFVADLLLGSPLAAPDWEPAAEAGLLDREDWDRFLETQAPPLRAWRDCLGLVTMSDPWASMFSLRSDVDPGHTAFLDDGTPGRELMDAFRRMVEQSDAGVPEEDRRLAREALASSVVQLALEIVQAVRTRGGLRGVGADPPAEWDVDLAFLLRGVVLSLLLLVQAKIVFASLRGASRAIFMSAFGPLMGAGSLGLATGVGWVATGLVVTWAYILMYAHSWWYTIASFVEETTGFALPRGSSGVAAYEEVVLELLRPAYLFRAPAELAAPSVPESPQDYVARWVALLYEVGTADFKNRLRQAVTRALTNTRVHDLLSGGASAENVARGLRVDAVALREAVYQALDADAVLKALHTVNVNTLGWFANVDWERVEQARGWWLSSSLGNARSRLSLWITELSQRPELGAFASSVPGGLNSVLLGALRAAAYLNRPLVWAVRTPAALSEALNMSALKLWEGAGMAGSAGVLAAAGVPFVVLLAVRAVRARRRARRGEALAEFFARAAMSDSLRRTVEQERDAALGRWNALAGGHTESANRGRARPDLWPENLVTASVREAVAIVFERLWNFSVFSLELYERIARAPLLIAQNQDRLEAVFEFLENVLVAMVVGEVTNLFLGAGVEALQHVPLGPFVFGWTAGYVAPGIESPFLMTDTLSEVRAVGLRYRLMLANFLLMYRSVRRVPFAAIPALFLRVPHITDLLTNVVEYWDRFNMGRMLSLQTADPRVREQLRALEIRRQELERWEAAKETLLRSRSDALALMAPQAAASLTAPSAPVDGTSSREIVFLFDLARRYADARRADLVTVDELARAVAHVAPVGGDLMQLLASSECVYVYGTPRERDEKPLTGAEALVVAMDAQSMRLTDAHVALAPPTGRRLGRLSYTLTAAGEALRGHYERALRVYWRRRYAADAPNASALARILVACSFFAHDSASADGLRLAYNAPLFVGTEQLGAGAAYIIKTLGAAPVGAGKDLADRARSLMIDDLNMLQRRLTVLPVFLYVPWLREAAAATDSTNFSTFLSHLADGDVTFRDRGQLQMALFRRLILRQLYTAPDEEGRTGAAFQWAALSVPDYAVELLQHFQKDHLDDLAAGLEARNIRKLRNGEVLYYLHGLPPKTDQFVPGPVLLASARHHFEADRPWNLARRCLGPLPPDWPNPDDWTSKYNLDAVRAHRAQITEWARTNSNAL